MIKFFIKRNHSLIKEQPQKVKCKFGEYTILFIILEDDIFCEKKIFLEPRRTQNLSMGKPEHRPKFTC